MLFYIHRALLRLTLCQVFVLPLEGCIDAPRRNQRLLGILIIRLPFEAFDATKQVRVMAAQVSMDVAECGS